MATEQVRHSTGSTFVPAMPQRQELTTVQMYSPSIIDLLPQAVRSVIFNPYQHLGK